MNVDNILLRNINGKIMRVNPQKMSCARVAQFMMHRDRSDDERACVSQMVAISSTTTWVVGMYITRSTDIVINMIAMAKTVKGEGMPHTDQTDKG